MIRAEREILEWLDSRSFGFQTAYELLPSRVAEADRILNGGFEDWTGSAADDWSTFGADSQFLEETSTQRSGSSCMRLERTGGSYGELWQVVQTRLERDAWYRVEYWIRGGTTEISGDRLLVKNVTRLEWWDPSSETWVGSITDAVSGGVTTTWRRRVAWFHVPAHWDLDDEIRIAFAPQFTPGDLVYLDDVVLYGPYDRKGLYFAPAALTWYGLDFTAQATSSQEAEETLSLEVPTFEVELDNVNLALRDYLEPVDRITGGRLRVWLIRLDSAGAPIETGEDPHLDGLLLGEWQIERPEKIDAERVTLPAVGLIDAHRQPVPRRRLATWCSARFADGVDCLYTTSGATASGAGASSTSLVLGDTGHYARFVAGDEISIGNGEPVTIASVNGTTDITLAEARTWADTNAIKHTTCPREWDACGRRLRQHEFLGFRGSRIMARLSRPGPGVADNAHYTGNFAVPRDGRPPRRTLDALADPTRAVPILIGRRWVPGTVIEVREYQGPVEGYQSSAFFVLSEGPVEQLWGWSVSGERVDSEFLGGQMVIGRYVRLGAIGVDDDETKSEYVADETTEERAQNRDFRSAAGQTYSRTAYVITVVDSGSDFEPASGTVLWDLAGLVVQAYDTAGAPDGSPAWTASPIWAAVALLTSARFGAGLRTDDVDLGLAAVEAAYAAEQIDSTVVDTTVTEAQGSPSQVCKVASTVGMRHGMSCTVNAVANTIQRIVGPGEIRLGTAVTQSVGHVVLGRPQRFEAHLHLDDADGEAPEAIETLLAACRGYVTYDRGQVQLRIERAHVADALAALNGSFDDWGSPTTPDDWSWVITGGAVNEETTEVHAAGGSALELDRTTTGSLWVYQELVLAPGYWLLTAWIKGEEALAAGLAVQVRNLTRSLTYQLPERDWDGGALEVIAYDVADDWTQVRLLFHVPASWAGDTIRVRLAHASATNAAIWVDDVELTGPLAGWYRDHDSADEPLCSHPGMAIARGTFEWVPRHGDSAETNQVVVEFTQEGLQPARDEATANDFEHQKRHVLRQRKVDGDAIADLDQAQRIAEYHLRRDRQLGPGAKFLAGPSALLVQPGDVVAVSHDDAGWDLELQRVVAKTLPGLGDEDEALAWLETEDYDPTIYPDAAAAIAPEPSDSIGALTLTVTGVTRQGRLFSQGRALACSWVWSTEPAAVRSYAVHVSQTSAFTPSPATERRPVRGGRGGVRGTSATVELRPDEVGATLYVVVVAITARGAVASNEVEVEGSELDDTRVDPVVQQDSSPYNQVYGGDFDVDAGWAEQAPTSTARVDPTGDSNGSETYQFGTRANARDDDSGTTSQGSSEAIRDTMPFAWNKCESIWTFAGATGKTDVQGRIRVKLRVVGDPGTCRVYYRISGGSWIEFGSTTSASYVTLETSEFVGLDLTAVDVLAIGTTGIQAGMDLSSTHEIEDWWFDEVTAASGTATVGESRGTLVSDGATPAELSRPFPGENGAVAGIAYVAGATAIVRIAAVRGESGSGPTDDLEILLRNTDSLEEETILTVAAADIVDDWRHYAVRWAASAQIDHPLEIVVRTLSTNPIYVDHLSVQRGEILSAWEPHVAEIIAGKITDRRYGEPVGFELGAWSGVKISEVS